MPTPNPAVEQPSRRAVELDRFLQFEWLSGCLERTDRGRERNQLNPTITSKGGQTDG